MINFSLIPVMTRSGVILYKQYTITLHAVLRYFERTGDDLTKLIHDIDGAWMFYYKRTTEHRKYLGVFIRAYREEAYVLTNGHLLFIVKPRESHRIITVIPM